jgi:hypothetical protein
VGLLFGQVENPFCVPTFAVLRRCPIADMTPPARLFALDGDGGIKRAML